jgi:hypothetical protein
MSKINQPLIMMKLGVIFFYVVAMVAHFYAPDGYNILEHNFSQLGPQYYDLSWIMQIAFIGSAVLWFYGLYLNKKHPVLHRSVAIMFFFIATFIVFAGLFKTNLPVMSLPLTYNTFEKNIHLFAAHGSQIFGLLILLEHIKCSDQAMRKRHVTVLVLLVILSVIFQFGPFVGLTQRILALTHSFWTLTYLNTYHKT